MVKGRFMMSKSINILIVEDEEQLCVGLRELLQGRGYQVEVAEDILQAQEKRKWAQERREPFHLYLLDVMLGRDSGFELCEEIRREEDVPVIFLTAMDDEDSVIRGLEIGADDYVTKPFRSRELLSRIEANVRRYRSGLNQNFPEQEVKAAVESEPAKGKQCFQSGEIVFVPGEERVYLKGKELKLRRTEIILLKYFMQNHGILLRREQILESLWDSAGDFVEDNTLSVQISRLRGQIGRYGDEGREYIETVRGIGYRWCPPVRCEVFHNA